MKKLIIMTFIITMLTVNIAFGIAIVDAACGSEHTVLLAEDGTVWTMGDNTYGQCGHNTGESMIRTPRQIKYIPKMKKVAATGYATMLLDEDGNAYIIDNNGCLEPCGIDNVVDIAMGGDGYYGTDDADDENMYALLTEDREVYTMGFLGYAKGSTSSPDYYPTLGRSMGDYDRGSIWNGCATASWKLAEISNGKALDDIVAIHINRGFSSGYNNSNRKGLTCLDEDGYIYFPCTYTKSNPVYMQKGSQLTSDISKKLFTAGLTLKDGYIDCNQIEAENEVESIKTKRGEVGIDNILCLVSNRSTSVDDIGSKSYEYSVAKRVVVISVDGKVYDCIKTKTNVNTYLNENYNISNKKIIKAAVGRAHTILIDEDGNVYAYGSNDRCQLGLNTDDEKNEVEVVETANSGYVTDGGQIISVDYWQGYLKLGNVFKFATIKNMINSSSNQPYEFDLRQYFGLLGNEITLPTLIESLQEIVPNEQSSLAYMTSDARVWIGGIANFSLMFEVEEDMTLRNAGTTLNDIFTNGALNIKLYNKNGVQITSAQGYVYNVYEDGSKITTITPNFIFKKGKLYQLECGIGGKDAFTVRGDTYTVKFEGINASKVKDGVVTQIRSSVDIAKFVLRVYVTELANLT